MTWEEMLDASLKLIATQNKGNPNNSYYLIANNEISNQSAEIIKILDTLKNDDYVVQFSLMSHPHCVILTGKGADFIRTGGYLQKIKKENDFNEMSYKKLRLETQYIKPAFWISILSLLISLWALFKK